MDQADLDRVNELFREMRQNDQGMHNLDAGAPIGTMIIPGPDQTTPSAVVRTDYIAYPEQMREAIKAALNNRNQEIVHQLEELGITGLAGR